MDRLTAMNAMQLTEDQTALRQIMRLRGFSIMTNVLEDYAADVEICSIVRPILSLVRNHIKPHGIV